MSKVPSNPVSAIPSTSIVVTRKTISKRLSTGQTITITPQDEKTLKTIYDYISGFTNRKNVEAAIEIKRNEVETLKQELSPRAKLLLKERVNQTFMGKSSHENDENAVESSDNQETQQQVNNQLFDGEHKLDEYYKAREQLLKLEERLKVYSSTDHKISARDIDGVVRLLGVTMNKRQIEVKIIYMHHSLVLPKYTYDIICTYCNHKINIYN